MSASVEVPLRPARRIFVAHPAIIFAALSMLFGTAIVFLTAPLRGPDEAAHFLRAYGFAQGDFLTSQADSAGRKGVFLPADLHREFAAFETANASERRTHWSREARLAKRATDGSAVAPAQVFVRYEGSEGYSPISYLPQVVGALVAQVIDFDFTATLMLMRLAGLAAFTAIIAGAIAIVPCFRWSFLAIAMLPAALYGRAVISADGATLACAMMATAIALRVALGGREPPARQAMWMTLAALTKPPTLLLVLLAPLGRRLKDWRTIALVVLPALVAAAAWIAATSGDVATWRIAELTGRDVAEFTPAAKLSYLWEHPLHFPVAALGTLKEAGELWRQMIGVLGLFDTVLQLWTYPVITALVLAACLTPIDASPALRRRIAAIAGVTAAAYLLGVFVIFYLIWTPADAEQVWGVQGRYFIPVLPLVAVVFSMTKFGPGEAMRARAALGAAILSGLASVEAILRTDWNFWG